LTVYTLSRQGHNIYRTKAYKYDKFRRDEIKSVNDFDAILKDAIQQLFYFFANLRDK